MLDIARPRLLRWCKGLGVDLGCGNNKICNNAIGIDKPFDVFKELPFKDEVFDFVFSSHCLEEANPEDVKTILREWTRILKRNGRLILYMPDKGFYYNIDCVKGNAKHKADYYWQDIVKLLPTNTQVVHADRHGRYKESGGDLNREQFKGKREDYGEHCFELVIEKT